MLPFFSFIFKSLYHKKIKIKKIKKAKGLKNKKNLAWMNIKAYGNKTNALAILFLQC